jgi:hypothetical protein
MSCVVVAVYSWTECGDALEYGGWTRPRGASASRRRPAYAGKYRRRRCPAFRSSPLPHALAVVQGGSSGTRLCLQSRRLSGCIHFRWIAGLPVGWLGRSGAPGSKVPGAGGSLLRLIAPNPAGAKSRPAIQSRSPARKSFKLGAIWPWRRARAVVQRHVLTDCSS